jgi:hypothetical protein
VVGFEPGRTTFTGLSLRGPRGNLDADGAVTFAGDLTARGRAWLTDAATHALLKPTGFAWLVSLIGVRHLASDFTLRGDIHGARLQAAIVHTPLWHLAGPFIPRDLNNLAHGRTPLWVTGS